MKNNSSRRLVIIGILLLSTTALGLAGVLNSFYSENVAPEEKNSQETARDYNPYEKSNGEDKQKIISVPPPAPGSGSVDNNDFKEGIPTGTYSHPPKTIKSSGSSSLSPESPLRDNNSSVERNKSIEENMAAENVQSTTPNYSQPLSSNNFNSSTSNSLTGSLGGSGSDNSNSPIQPLGDNNTSLEIPSSQRESRSITPSPLEKSSLGRSSLGN